MGEDVPLRFGSLGFLADSYSDLEESVLVSLRLDRDGETVRFIEVRFTHEQALEVADSMKGWVELPDEGD
jgi:hypothetical protein